MTSCTIIGLVVSCSIDAGTRLPPADAAAKMQAPFVYVAPAEMLWWDDRPVYYDRSWPFSKESRQLTLGYRVRTQSPRERRRR